MFTLSAFADEVSDDFTEQMDVLEREGVKHIELRGVWGKNVLQLTDDEVARVKEESAARGFGFSAIGSPIGKIKIANPFEPHVERFKRAIWVAKELACPNIRVFSYYMPKGEDPAGSRDEVMRRMRAKVGIAEGVMLLHENERDIYGDTGERCLDILTEVASDGLGGIFDPANFVQSGENALECWAKLKPHVKYFHIKDSRADGTVVPAGEGDGHFVEILTEAVAMGFDGFASLEPHLMHAGRSTGKTGPELFKVAADALKGVLAKAGGEIRDA